MSQIECVRRLINALTQRISRKDDPAQIASGQAQDGDDPRCPFKASYEEYQYQWEVAS